MKNDQFANKVISPIILLKYWIDSSLIICGIIVSGFVVLSEQNVFTIISKVFSFILVTLSLIYACLIYRRLLSLFSLDDSNPEYKSAFIALAVLFFCLYIIEPNGFIL